MTAFPNERSPELDTITLELTESRIRLDTFLEYSFNSDFLTPTDGWSFTVAGDSLPDQIKDALVVGKKVSLYVDNNVQATGYIDTITHTGDRGGGYEISIEGRDTLAYAVDGHIDPRTQFKDSMTLLDLMIEVYGNFGFSEFVADNEANRNVLTGGVRGKKTSIKGRPLKKWVLNQLKPDQSEGAHAFASRVAQRFGLWIRASADGETLIVGKPEFDLSANPSKYRIHRRVDDGGRENNVLHGTVSYDAKDQPSIIYGWSAAGHVEFPKARIRAAVRNPFVDTDTKKIEAAYPDVKPKGTVDKTLAFKLPHARPIYMRDQESQTQEQIEYFVQRELSLYTRRSLVCHYTVPGHTSNSQPWAVDTHVDVDDQRGNVHETMWIKSRTFSKSRSGGTTTTIECIRRNSLVF